MQVFDESGNSEPLNVTIVIDVINDNVPELFLGGDTVNYTTVFLEGQDYLGGPLPLHLSEGLRITDIDSGENSLVQAQVQITGGNCDHFP